MTTLIKLNHINNAKIKALNADIEKMTVEHNSLIRTGIENTLKAIIYITNISTISINFIHMNSWPGSPTIDIGLKIENDIVEIRDGEFNEDTNKISINKDSPLTTTDVLHTLLNVYFILDNYYSCFLPEDEDMYTLLFDENGLITT